MLTISKTPIVKSKITKMFSTFCYKTSIWSMIIRENGPLYILVTKNDIVLELQFIIKYNKYENLLNYPMKIIHLKIKCI